MYGGPRKVPEDMLVKNWHGAKSEINAVVHAESRLGDCQNMQESFETHRYTCWGFKRM